MLKSFHDEFDCLDSTFLGTPYGPKRVAVLGVALVVVVEEEEKEQEEARPNLHQTK